MDLTQLLLIISLIVTSIFLVLVGLNLIFLLVELKKAVKKINLISDAFEKFGQGIGSGVKDAISLFKAKKRKHKS